MNIIVWFSRLSRDIATTEEFSPLLPCWSTFYLAQCLCTANVQKALSSIPEPVNSNAMLATTHHRCAVSSELCCPGAKPRRWIPPLVTRFGVISRVYWIGFDFLIWLPCCLQRWTPPDFWRGMRKHVGHFSTMHICTVHMSNFESQCCEYPVRTKFHPIRSKFSIICKCRMWHYAILIFRSPLVINDWIYPLINKGLYGWSSKYKRSSVRVSRVSWPFFFYFQIYLL